MLGSDAWVPNLFSGAVLAVVVLGVPALGRVTKKRRDAGKTAAEKVSEDVDQLKKDRNLIFDWLLGPVGFDGVRRGGFKETDEAFKSKVLNEIGNGK